MSGTAGGNIQRGHDPSEASMLDTLRVATEIMAPTVATGVIKRRPIAMAANEKLGADRHAIGLAQQLRERYGPGPLRLRMPGRSVALVLAAEDVGTLLAGSPDPFTPASDEKRAALARFQPHGVLISQGRARPRRREINESLLDTGKPLHRLAAPFAATVRDECDHLLLAADADGELSWSAFNRAWWRVVRRIVLGDAARDEETVTDLLASLRRSANWAYLGRPNAAAREDFDRRLGRHIDRAEQGSLAALIADSDAGGDKASAEARDEAIAQVPHWLFAFDAAGMATMRTLALLASHPEHARRAAAEVGDAEGAGPAPLPFLRACVLDAVRLWPTTPALLRESTTSTMWGDQPMPPRTTFLIYTPLFHRDTRTLPYADRFSPDIWLDGTAQRNPALVPFSDGAGRCPGRNLVLLVVSTMLARLLESHSYQLTSDTRVDPERPMPATLDNFSFRFRLTPR